MGLRQRQQQVIVFLKLTLISTGFFLAFLGLGCGGKDSTAPITLKPTLSSIQSEIFTPTCSRSGCHDLSQREAGLCLVEGESATNLIGVQPSTVAARTAGRLRVDPGNPGNSFLLEKLKGPPSNEGVRMPFGGPYLSPQEIQVIQRWIEEGAQP